MELRCSTKKHAVLLEGGLLEVKCDSRYCGHEQGTVVLHRFDVGTGELVETVKFKDPVRRKSGTKHHPASVRAS